MKCIRWIWRHDGRRFRPAGGEVWGLEPWEPTVTRRVNFKIGAVGSRCLVALAVLGWAMLDHASRALWAQGASRSASKFYPDSSEQAETLLRNAASHARDGQWGEAIRIYQRVIDQYGGKVARLSADDVGRGQELGDDFVLYVQLREFCQRRLAALPPEGREIYRRRMDAIAEQWYREGSSGFDPEPLRRVVDRAFCSSWGDDALELLGDLAFREGRFGEALAMYRRLVPDEGDNGSSLIHPDPSVDLARVAAKKILSLAAAGSESAAIEEAAAFGERFPGASGSLAGRRGVYAQIVQEALRSDRLGGDDPSGGRWPTFAGAQSRSMVLPEAIDVGSVQWRVPLEKVVAGRQGYPYAPRAVALSATAAPPEKLLAYHPILVGDQVIVCDGSRVVAYNLNDRPASLDGGAILAVDPAWKHDPESSIPQVTRNLGIVPRFTLTAVANRIYARMGPASPPGFLMNRGGGGTATSYLVALDGAAQGKLLWLIKASELLLPNRPAERNGRSVSFEGTPVADARNVYVAVTDRREQTATYVACFDAETGASRWIHYLGAAASEIDNFMAMGMGFGAAAAGDFGHRLLSLEGPVLYYQTNLGALVSLEAETGAVRWVATYPRQDSGRGGSVGDRDLNPAIIHQGLVIVAPSDASAIFAFDAASGRLVWKTDPIADEVKLSHLLGVAKGRLVATGDRVLIFDVRDGKLLATWPDSGRSMEGYGRGLLAGDRIYWPTRNEIQILDQRSGTRVAPPIKLMENYRVSGGNLVAGDGYLIVAQPDALVVFCQNSRLIERYQEEIARDPSRASTHYRLARAAEAVGRDQLALESYKQTRQRATLAEIVDGIPLSEAARGHELRLRLRLAADARRRQQPTQATAHLAASLELARSDEDRLRVRIQLAEAQLEQDRPEEAIQNFQEILADERMRGLTLAAEDGHRAMRADLWITDRLASVIRSRGRAIYESFEAKARQLYRRGLEEGDPRILDGVSRIFPVAEVVPEALIELGRIEQTAGSPAAAARAYRRLIAAPAAPDAARARAFWRLAQVYLSQNYVVAARDTYVQLLTRYPDLRLEELGAEHSLADLVSAELARPPLAQVAAERPRPPIVWPLGRSWRFETVSHAPAGRLLLADGIPPAPESTRVFLAEKTTVSPVEPGQEEPRWSVHLGGPPTWVGYFADKLIAGTSHGLLALDQATGVEHWRFGKDDAESARRSPDPFHRGGNGGSDPAGPIRVLQVVGGRVFLLRGEQELLALDGDTGAVDWSFAARGGGINPRLWIGPERIVFQVQKPNQILVIETETGRQLARAVLGDGDQLQRPPVPVDSDHVLLVPDRRTVRKLELSRGQVIWDYRESQELPVNGPPRVMVDAERLLILHDGRVLIRLDPETGSKQWSTVLGTEDLSERPEALACHGGRIFCVSRQGLRALSLENGAVLWNCHLGGPENALWTLALSDRCVLTYPRTSHPSDEERENLPLIVRRQDNGALVQRFLFSATISDVTLRLDARGAMLATPQSVWKLEPRSGEPASHLSAVP